MRTTHFNYNCFYGFSSFDLLENSQRMRSSTAHSEQSRSNLQWRAKPKWYFSERKSAYGLADNFLRLGKPYCFPDPNRNSKPVEIARSSDFAALREFVQMTTASVLGTKSVDWTEPPSAVDAKRVTFLYFQVHRSGR
jgi:hypothetical protein